MWIPCLLAAVLLPSDAPSPLSVTGRVVDGRTGVALSDVAVSVAPRGASTRTDGEGRFVIAGLAAGEAELLVSAVGYALARRRIVVAPGAAEVIVPLSDGVGTYVEEITVVAGRFGRPEPLVPAQHELGSGELQSLRGLLLDDPLRALHTLPGVSAADDLHATFALRGSGLRHVGFTLDGVPAPFLLHTVQETEGGGSIGMVNSDVLDGVSLVAGGQPQRFGGRLGGRVDFRTREGSRERWRGAAALSGTSASATLEGPFPGGNGSWLVSARKSYLDLLLERLFPDETFVFGFEDAQARLVFDLSPRHQLQATVLAGRSRFDDSADLGVADTADAENRSGLATLGWRALAGARAVVTQRVHAAGVRFANFNRSGAVLDRGEWHELAYRLDAAAGFGRRVQVEAGWEVRGAEESRFRQRGALNDTLRREEELEDAATTAGGYLAARWPAGARVELGPGVRIDHWTLTGETSTSPWLLAQWEAPGSWRVSAGAGLYHQPPDFRHVSGLQGNPALRSERALHLDLALEREIGRSLRWRVTAFDREERGLLRRPGAEFQEVAGVLRPPVPEGPWVNALDGHARGFELLLQRKDPNGLSGWIGYSFAATRYHDRTTGEAFRGDYDQPHAVNVYLSWRLTARTSVSGRFRASSNFPIPGYWETREDRFGYFVGDRRNELRLPAYSRLDLRADHAVTLGKARLTVFGEISNVLNRANYRMGEVDVSAATGRVTDLTEDMLPIVPSLGLRVEF